MPYVYMVRQKSIMYTPAMKFRNPFFILLKFVFHHKNVSLKPMCYVTVQVNLGEIGNMVLQFWLPKQGKVGHP